MDPPGGFPTDITWVILTSKLAAEVFRRAFR